MAKKILSVSTMNPFDEWTTAQGIGLGSDRRDKIEAPTVEPEKVVPERPPLNLGQGRQDAEHAKQPAGRGNLRASESIGSLAQPAPNMYNPEALPEYDVQGNPRTGGNR